MNDQIQLEKYFLWNLKKQAFSYSWESINLLKLLPMQKQNNMFPIIPKSVDIQLFCSSIFLVSCCFGTYFGLNEMNKCCIQDVKLPKQCLRSVFLVVNKGTLHHWHRYPNRTLTEPLGNRCKKFNTQYIIILFKKTNFSSAI